MSEEFDFRNLDRNSEIYRKIYVSLAQLQSTGELSVTTLNELKSYFKKYSSVFKTRKQSLHGLLILFIQKSANEKRLQNTKDFPVGNFRNWLCEVGLELTFWIDFNFEILKLRHES